jgi:hypothetical protein
MEKGLPLEEHLHDNPQGTKSLHLLALVMVQAVCPVQAQLRHALCLTFLLHKKALGVQANTFFLLKKKRKIQQTKQSDYSQKMDNKEF